MGAKHFYLYNNLSQDNYLEVLQPYIESGDVELIEWPYRCQNLWQHCQCFFYWLLATDYRLLKIKMIQATTTSFAIFKSLFYGDFKQILQVILW